MSAVTPNSPQEQVWAGQKLYTRTFLTVYDPVALGFHCRFIWRCSRSHLLEFYNRHVSGNHLDIGVGTGYFVDRCHFPVKIPRLALMDLNPNCLRFASRRLARYRPEIYQRNVLEPIKIDVPRFDSIAIFNLLHCLPGDMTSKAQVFEHVRPLLNPGGVLFGSTMVYKGVRRGIVATLVFQLTNKMKFMSNKEDGIDELRANLELHFSASHVELAGCEAVFWARR
ncbi:MAG: class I SAM-dependent methyltransferase [Dehalococcoidia bacterium]|nr:class I SAM-dependent methyltransferase [Dehalococcoidia bacterium]